MGKQRRGQGGRLSGRRRFRRPWGPAAAGEEGKMERRPRGTYSPPRFGPGRGEEAVLRGRAVAAIAALVGGAARPGRRQGRRQGGGEGPGPPMVPKFPLEI